MLKGLLVVVICILCGCHVEKRPQTWGQTLPEFGAQALSAIEGEYSNIGEDPKGNKVTFAMWLTMGADPGSDLNAKKEFYRELRDASVVELRLPDEDKITVVAKGDNIHKEWSFFKNLNQYEFKNGVLRIQWPLSGSSVNAVGHASSYIEIQRVGNYLIVHKNSTWVGVMLLVPAGEHQSLWARFALSPPKL